MVSFLIFVNSIYTFNAKYERIKMIEQEICDSFY